jgi:hypothetical protein
MNNEQWDITVDRIEKQFGITDRGKEDLSDVAGWEEWVEFDGPQGRMKLARTVRPRVKAEHTTYSKRIGGSVTVKKVYDPDEVVSFVKAYRWNEGTEGWDEVKAAW